MLHANENLGRICNGISMRNLDQLEELLKKVKSKTIRTEPPSESIAGTSALPNSRNHNADCLAEKLANQFKKQPCASTTGANTVPGTEPQFSNYSDLLSKCHLPISNTRDGNVMPAYVPGLLPSLRRKIGLFSRVN
ncbi:hypothetical protein JHK85_017015 [Glycine max]|nr:hypothetical protein JHK85_017015 [Glycine max]